jgi:hypothetical protein
MKRGFSILGITVMLLSLILAVNIGAFPEREVVAQDIYNSIGDETVSTGIDELSIHALPNTGAGTTAEHGPPVRNHANAWHFLSSYCYNHGYYQLWAWAYYYDGWSHLFSSRQQRWISSC